MDAFHQSRMAKLKLDEETWDLECAVLKHLAEVWDQPDHGIWERRGDPKHYVFSKVQTWVAFDRGIKSAETFGLNNAPLDDWRRLRDTICQDVCENGFDRELNSFVESYGSKMLDASLLLLPSVGFLQPDDPRVCGTIAAIEKHMMRDGFVLRHDPREGVEPQPAEGAFLACTLWLADAHVLAGEVPKAQALFDRVVAVTNDLGLLAEEYDSDAKRQAGNFPQALTHIALVNTAHNLDEARKHHEKPAVQRSK
jgi:GH15 family glucan-1,4-alpha-glucosidase